MTHPDYAARPDCAAGALFVDDEGRVLIVEPTYKPRWEIPGGRVERGETPRAACLRELREELGLDLPLGRLLVVDWAPNVRDEHVRFVFDGGTLTDEQLDAIDLAPRRAVLMGVPAARGDVRDDDPAPGTPGDGGAGRARAGNHRLPGERHADRTDAVRSEHLGLSAAGGAHPATRFR